MLAAAALGASLLMEVRAYGIGCDAPGPFTSSGTRPVAKWTVAADPAVLPPGSLVHVEGLGARRVEDTGGAIVGNVIDLFMATCDEAHAWGIRARHVAVLYLPPQRPRAAGVETLAGRNPRESPASRGSVAGDSHKRASTEPARRGAKAPLVTNRRQGSESGEVDHHSKLRDTFAVSDTIGRTPPTNTPPPSTPAARSHEPRAGSVEVRASDARVIGVLLLLAAGLLTLGSVLMARGVWLLTGEAEQRERVERGIRRRLAA